MSTTACRYTALVNLSIAPWEEDTAVRLLVGTVESDLCGGGFADVCDDR